MSSNGDLAVFRHEATGKRSGVRIRRAVTIATGVLVATLVAWFVLTRYGPDTVDVHGTWAIHQIDHDGRTVITSEDLGDSRWTIEFPRGNDAAVDTGCNTDFASYHVAFSTLRFGGLSGPAGGCGYATPGAEQLANTVGTAVTAITEGASTVSRPDSDTLVITTDHYRVTYRSTAAAG